MAARSGPDHRRRTGGHARAVLDRARALSRGAADLPAATERLQDSIRTQVAALERRLVQDRLAETPAEELRKLAPDLRLGGLLDAGFGTVAEIRAAPVHRLRALPGVGRRTARDAKDAAEAAAAKIEAATRFRFDPDRGDDDQTSLLAALTAERHARTAAEALREPLAEHAERLAAHLPAAERATSRTSMSLAGRRRAAEALDALTALEAVLDEPGVRRLEQALADARHRADPDAYDRDDLWRALEAEPAYYSAAIANLTGAAAPAEDHIGGDLRERVDTVELDLGLLTCRLREYQAFGAKFAVHQGKAVIGDETGLGKTVQALAVCAHLAAGGGRHFLVVCPASVEANWTAEARRRTSLDVYDLHGPDREEQGAKWLREGGLAVAAFNALHRLECLERDGLYLALLVVDEAHRAGSPELRRALAVLDVREHARRTLFLTGAPLEHRVDELRDLVSYLEPGLAGEIGPGGTAAGALRRLVAPVYLRRDQEDVLAELPERIEVQDRVRLSGLDEERYRAEVRAGSLAGMRRAASALPDSEKLERLAELVEAAEAEGRKTAVCSSFPDVLEAVQKRLGPLAIGTLTSEVPAEARRGLLDAFARADEPAVLLARLEEGGAALDLRAASLVVVCEPQWDPGLEGQALPPAGRGRRAQVRRLLAQDCVDERIGELREGRPLLFEHFAHRGEAGQLGETAMNTRRTRPLALDDESVPLEERIVTAERIRLGLD
ncbi:SNF2-related protein [Glycomyces sp. A-F 0318]|uniref:DEAD/DEAH box helicase n=1 Tax=Glycomyces amatae TaxID=2881355 RepID=UPI001E58660C|nr:SNF2-related protein [Glycomyces amatae]MCD0445003.1 SNF2-related protein [Glycomyces amatae]